MGQQQLLLVMLVTIIVGIATVVAINTFGSAADQANIDAVRQDLATIAASAKGYYMKPGIVGGGGRSFSSISFSKMAVPGDVTGSNNEILTNENGVYEITTIGENQFTVTATPANSTGTEDGIVADITASNMSIRS